MCAKRIKWHIKYRKLWNSSDKWKRSGAVEWNEFKFIENEEKRVGMGKRMVLKGHENGGELLCINMHCCKTLKWNEMKL